MTACLLPNLSAIASQPAEQCAGYVLVTGAEYQNLAMLSGLFTIPDTTALQGAFTAGFTLPLICFMTAWAYGSVINFISSRR